MYCANCGVELAATEKRCPLCGTRAHPDLTAPKESDLYPRERYPSTPNSRFYPLLFTVIFLLPIPTVIFSDIGLGGGITWAGYVIGALVVLYTALVLPMWFHKPNPVIFVPCGFAAAILYLLYIDLAVGGNWFLSFAFPVAGAVALIITAVVTLVRYVNGGKLFIYGGAITALGGLCLLTEFLMDITFPGYTFIGWAVYPLSLLVMVGGLLIFLGICRPAREIMERKFFI